MKHALVVKGLLVIHIVCYFLGLLAVLASRHADDIEAALPVIPFLAYACLAVVVALAVVGYFGLAVIRHQRTDRTVWYLLLADVLLAASYVPTVGR